MQAWGSVLVIAAGVFGVAGVGAGALAAHGPGGTPLAIASQFLMIHAAAILALAFGSSGLLAWSAATLLAAGLVFFAGDLASLGLRGAGLFSGAAPIGGLALMGGWLLVAATGVRHLIMRRT